MKRVFLQASGRSGSHHVLSNLHYQDEFFCLSEHEQITKNKSPSRKDCFHKIIPIKNEKYKNAKAIVWNKKNLRSSSGYNNFYSSNSIDTIWVDDKTKSVRKEKLEEFLKNEDEYAIFLFRHPILVCDSLRRIAGGKVSFERNLDGICDFFQEGYEAFERLKEEGFRVLDLFFESFLIDKKREIERIYEWLDLDLPDKIKDHNDYFLPHANIVGPGNYIPERTVAFDEQTKLLNKLEEQVELEHPFLQEYNQILLNLKK